MEKLIKGAFKALAIGLAVIACCPMNAETACAAVADNATTTNISVGGKNATTNTTSTATVKNDSAVPQAVPAPKVSGTPSKATIVGGAVGGTVGVAAGATAGAVIGGIGVVACGTGFGIPVGVVCLGLATVCGAAGAGVGSFIGSFF